MTPEACAEVVRDSLPLLAEPIKPGENVASWIERAARRCGVNAGRLKAYWHRRVSRPTAHEYLAIVGAAEEAARRKQAIETLQNEIETRAAELRAASGKLRAASSVLGHLAPPVPRSAQAVVDAAPLRKRP